MIEQLKVIVELQKLDTDIIVRSRVLTGIPSKMSAMEKPLSDARLNLERQKRSGEDLEKKKREKESELSDINDRVVKLKARMAEIKDNKTYQAHLKEIEAAEKSVRDVEDAVLAFMEDIESEGKRLKAAEAALEVEKKKEAELRKKLEEEAAQAQKELDELKSKRKSLSAGLDSETYGLYMGLLQSRRGLAAVEARGEVCQGCNMNIMPQLFVELKQGDRLIQCPQCQRILYYIEKEESPSLR